MFSLGLARSQNMSMATLRSWSKTSLPAGMVGPSLACWDTSLLLHQEKLSNQSWQFVKVMPRTMVSDFPLTGTRRRARQSACSNHTWMPEIQLIIHILPDTPTNTDMDQFSTNILVLITGVLLPTLYHFRYVELKTCYARTEIRPLRQN